MERFYTHLLDGTGKAQALQAAQYEIRTDPEHPEWEHPYYWAAFVLNGDPGTTDAGLFPAPGVTPGAAPTWVRYAVYGAVAVGMLAVAVGFILLRRRSNKPGAQERM